MFKYIITQLTTLFAIIEYDTLFKKLEASYLLAIITSPIGYLIYLISTYVLYDTKFVEILIILILLDTFVGFLKHWKLHTISWSDFYIKLMLKVVISMTGMILFNVFAEIKDVGTLGITTWLLLIGKLANFFYVGGSAIDSLYILSGGKFPPVGIMKRIKKFNTTGDINDLTKKHKR